MTAKHYDVWTNDEIAQLTEWANHFSATEIGRKLKKTRNSVLGKLHRLGLRKETKARTRTYNTAKSQSKPARRVLNVPLLNELHPSINGPTVHFLDLTPRQCRFPAWVHESKPTHQYCGCRTAFGKNYCTDHLALAFTERKRTAIH